MAEKSTKATADESPLQTDDQKATAKESKPSARKLAPLNLAFDEGSMVEGRIIGWNKGGFHVVVDGVTAFCPRSEIEMEADEEPKAYVDQVLDFKVLEIRKGGRRVVLSRSASMREERNEKSQKARGKLVVGAVVTGKVASLTDFGAFVDLGGVQGLIHISELSRSRVEHPSDVLEVDQDVEVKVLKLDQGGKRISLSIKALEPDPWAQLDERIQEGLEVTGIVEKTERFGALIRLAPGLTGLLPTSQMSLPRDTSPARAYPQGREVQVQIMSIDPRRKRISLAPKGTAVGGSKSDFEDYKKSSADGAGFNALAAAFRKRQGS